MALISGVTVTERRPCWVKGLRAMFHKWADKTVDVFISNMMVPSIQVEEARQYYDSTGIVPNGFRIEKITNTYALVEFEDGRVEEIAPTTITFLDHSEFEGYDWNEKESVENPFCCSCKFTHLPSNAARPCYKCKFNKDLNDPGVDNCWIPAAGDESRKNNDDYTCEHCVHRKVHYEHCYRCENFSNFELRPNIRSRK